MSWHSFDSGKSIGQPGSELGVIVCDEEHGDAARITLERGGRVAPYAITCGIYGWMMHTRFFSDECDGQHAYEQMKQALDNIIRSIPLENDPDLDIKLRTAEKMIKEFVEQYP